MKIRAQRIVAIALLSAFVSAITPALAADLSLYFNGTIMPGSVIFPVGHNDVPTNWDNQPFSGVVTFDPATAVPFGDPPLGWQGYAAHDGLMTMRLYLPDGVVIDSDRHISSASGAVYVYRNYVNPPDTNALLLYMNTEGAPHDELLHSNWHVSWEAIDRLGTSSTLFAPNGGLSLSQPFNLNEYPFSSPNTSGAPWQYGEFNISAVSSITGGWTYNYVADFTLTAIGTSPPVPEPDSYALLGLGLIVLTLRCRRSRQANPSTLLG